MVKSMLKQQLTKDSKNCAADIQVRFRIFNLALSLLSVMRLYREIFKEFTEAIHFQYLAYQFIWQYFDSKNKFLNKESGKSLGADVNLLKITVDVNKQIHIY